MRSQLHKDGREIAQCIRSAEHHAFSSVHADMRTFSEIHEGGYAASLRTMLFSLSGA